MFSIMKLAIPPKKDLNQEAKDMKKFMILLKKKLTRQQISRSPNFRKLLALVFDPNEQELGWVIKKKTEKYMFR